MYFDNGTEFINETVEEHFMNKNGIVIPLFRSRPYRKNDQARVEQKNWTHVRGIWGYVRIDHQPVLGLMNSVAENLWLPLQNGFVPQRKTVAKVRVGSKIKKQFDTARTPGKAI
jgi:hypothetical protein